MGFRSFCFKKEMKDKVCLEDWQKTSKSKSGACFGGKKEDIQKGQWIHIVEKYYYLFIIILIAIINQMV